METVLNITLLALSMVRTKVYCYSLVKRNNTIIIGHECQWRLGSPKIDKAPPRED